MQEPIRFQSGDERLFVLPEVWDCFKSSGLNSVGDFFTKGDLIRTVGSKENVILDLGSRFYLKRHRGPGNEEGLVEWENTRAAARLGIPTALPVAAGASPFGSFFCSQALVGAAPLDEALDKASLTRSQKLALVESLARIAAGLHRNALFHRDLYLCHFFAQADDLDHIPLTLIDLQRLLKPHVLRRRWMIKDLAALNYSASPALASRTLRLRFFKAWCREMTWPGPLRRHLRFLHAVVRKTERIRRHDEKKREARGQDAGCREQGYNV